MNKDIERVIIDAREKYVMCELLKKEGNTRMAAKMNEALFHSIFLLAYYVIFNNNDWLKAWLEIYNRIYGD